MKVYMYVYDNIYGGYHGLEDNIICEVDSADELNDYFVESINWLFDSYDCYDDYITDDENMVEEYGECDCYKIRDDVTLSLKELGRIVCSIGKNTFVEKYCSNDSLIF